MLLMLLNKSSSLKQNKGKVDVISSSNLFLRNFKKLGEKNIALTVQLSSPMQRYFYIYTKRNVAG